MRVFVINQRGKPLMPTFPAKAKKLLKAGKAKVFRREPFTIQLQVQIGEAKQEIHLGVDAGTKHIGLSATTRQVALFEAEVMLRTDIQELIASRAAFRRARRNRKTRYRKPRFLNRKKANGWLAPSIQNKIDAHLKVIQLAYQLLPITTIIVEAAQFDLQKLKNPDIDGVEYQQGEQLGFWNVREYVLFRDKHTCQWCKGKSRDAILNVHHIESRKTGGDSPANLITLCETCHHKVHREGLTEQIKRKFPALRDASQITVLRWFILEAIKKRYPNTVHTYGYLTKNTRIRSGLEKAILLIAAVFPATR